MTSLPCGHGGMLNGLTSDGCHWRFLMPKQRVVAEGVGFSRRCRRWRRITFQCTTRKHDRPLRPCRRPSFATSLLHRRHDETIFHVAAHLDFSKHARVRHVARRCCCHTHIFCSSCLAQGAYNVVDRTFRPRGSLSRKLRASDAAALRTVWR